MQKQTLIRNGSRVLLAVAIAVGLVLAGLELSEKEASEDASASGSDPALVESMPGTDLKRVTLTSSAAERTGVESVRVKGRPARKVVPYSAILYDEHGKTWVYTSPARLTFVRAPIAIDSIRGEVAVLSKGPRLGTLIVTVGAAELFGAEFEVDQ